MQLYEDLGTARKHSGFQMEAGATPGQVLHPILSPLPLSQE